MANIQLNDIVQVSFRGLCFAQRILLVRNYRVSKLPTATTTVNDFSFDIANAFAVGGNLTAMTARYLACLSSAYAMRVIRAQVIKPNRYRSVEVAREAPGTSGPANTANICAVITLNSERAGRDQISNVHIGPIGTADSLAGDIAAGAKGNLSEFADDLRTTLSLGANLGEITPIIYHARVPGPVIAYDDIIDAVVQDTTRTMRRRTLGRGE